MNVKQVLGGAAMAAMCCMAQTPALAASQSMQVKPEVIDASVALGVLSIEDFTSELAVGVSASFLASEDLFIEYNFLATSISESAFEKNAAFTTFTLGEGRRFRHYDLLLGYNLFQTEFLVGDAKSILSKLYLVAGVGDTQFGTEDNFTYTLGVGYRVRLSEKLFFKIDYRNHIYDSALVTGTESDVYHVTQFSSAFGVVF